MKNVYLQAAVMPEQGGGGPLAPPIFARSVNPIPTEGGQIIPIIGIFTPKFFHIPASLSTHSAAEKWCGNFLTFAIAPVHSVAVLFFASFRAN